MTFGEKVSRLRKQNGYTQKELADELNVAFADKDPIILSVLKGSFIFTSDLVRYLNFPFELDFIRASSYGNDTKSSGKVKISGLDINIKDRDIILIDDILDTGYTLKALINELKKLRVNSITTVVIVNKPSRRKVDLIADYVGFDVPNEFLVGYGMDYQDRDRNLPYIAAVDIDK